MADTRQLIELTRRKRELDAESRKLAAEIDALEAELLEEWTEAGRSSETIDGYTAYLSSRDWATPRDGDRNRVVRALEALGMDDMVTYNTQTLSAWYKERAEAGEEVPPTLDECVELTTKWSINVRRK